MDAIINPISQVMELRLDDLSSISQLVSIGQWNKQFGSRPVLL